MIEVSGYRGGQMIAHFLCVTNSVIEANKRFKSRTEECTGIITFYRPVNEKDPKNLPLIKSYMLEKAII